MSRGRNRFHISGWILQHPRKKTNNVKEPEEATLSSENARKRLSGRSTVLDPLGAYSFPRPLTGGYRLLADPYQRIVQVSALSFGPLASHSDEDSRPTQMGDFQERSLEFLFRANIRQEGQHPLTGQRAPPISGGTYRRRRTLIHGYLESPFPTACLL